MRAWLNLRYLTKRRAAFAAGLARLGYRVADGLPSEFGDRDILVTWNRIGAGELAARRFEARGQPVLVAENASWGNDWIGRRWYHIAQRRHNTAGCFPVFGPERWDALGAPLSPFRAEGETVLLPQRGFGSAPTRMPGAWSRRALKRYGGRLRPHPGRHRAAVSLFDDLRRCGRVVTWGSGAAIKALMWGVPVISEMPHWIGAQSNTEEDRLRLFRELAWSQWTLEEIASGEPFARLLS